MDDGSTRLPEFLAYKQHVFTEKGELVKLKGERGELVRLLTCNLFISWKMGWGSEWKARINNFPRHGNTS